MTVPTGEARAPAGTVVIPVLDDRDHLRACLAALAAAGGPELEVVVVDGGSVDGSAEDLPPDVRVLRAERGRARQMNAGAAGARGEWILFLHADTRLPAGAAAAVARTLADPDIVGGAFSVDFLESFRGRRLLAFGANLRARLLGLPLGDQGLFVRRAAFEALGGFPDLPLMEDVALVRALRRRGRLRLLELRVRTSARRWQREGPWRTLRNWALLALFHAGVSPWRLKQWYSDLR